MTSAYAGRGATGQTGGAHAIAIVAPTCNPGDLLIATLSFKGAVTSCSCPGWTEKGHDTLGNAACRWSILYKIATAADSGASFTFTKDDLSDVNFGGVISRWVGRKTTGDPFDGPLVVSNNASATSIAFAAKTPTPGSHPVLFGFHGFGSPSDSFGHGTIPTLQPDILDDSGILVTTGSSSNSTFNRLWGGVTWTGGAGGTQQYCASGESASGEALTAFSWTVGDAAFNVGVSCSLLPASPCLNYTPPSTELALFIYMNGGKMTPPTPSTAQQAIDWGWIGFTSPHSRVLLTPRIEDVQTTGDPSYNPPNTTAGSYVAGKGTIGVYPRPGDGAGWPGFTGYKIIGECLFNWVRYVANNHPKGWGAFTSGWAMHLGELGAVLNLDFGGLFALQTNGIREKYIGTSVVIGIPPLFGNAVDPSNADIIASIPSRGIISSYIAGNPTTCTFAAGHLLATTDSIMIFDNAASGGKDINTRGTPATISSIVVNTVTISINTATGGVGTAAVWANYSNLAVAGFSHANGAIANADLMTKAMGRLKTLLDSDTTRPSNMPAPSYIFHDYEPDTPACMPNIDTVLTDSASDPTGTKQWLLKWRADPKVSTEIMYGTSKWSDIDLDVANTNRAVPGKIGVDGLGADVICTYNAAGGIYDTVNKAAKRWFLDKQERILEHAFTVGWLTPAKAIFPAILSSNYGNHSHGGNDQGTGLPLFYPWDTTEFARNTTMDLQHLAMYGSYPGGTFSISGSGATLANWEVILGLPLSGRDTGDGTVTADDVRRVMVAYNLMRLRNMITKDPTRPVVVYISPTTDSSFSDGGNGNTAPAAEYRFTNATWTAASKTVTSTGTFTKAVVGQAITFTAAGGATAGVYIVATVAADGNSLTLTTQIKASDIASGATGAASTYPMDLASNLAMVRGAYALGVRKFVFYSPFSFSVAVTQKEKDDTYTLMQALETLDGGGGRASRTNRRALRASRT